MTTNFKPDKCPAFQPCYNAEDCWDVNPGNTLASPDHYDTCTSSCWKLMWAMLVSGIVLIAYGDISIGRTSLGALLRRYLRKVKEYRTRFQWYQSNFPDKSKDEIDTRIQQTKERKTDIFTTTNRRARLFSNFAKDLNDPSVELPESPAGREYQAKVYSPASYSFSAFGMICNLGHILSTEYIYAIVWSSLGWGLFASGISTYLWLARSHGEFCVENGYYKEDVRAERSQRYTEIYHDIRFNYLYLTLFVLTGYVAFVAARWRTWLQNCHDIQNGLHSIAMLCGGAIKNPIQYPGLLSSEDIAITRFRLYKIYRYLNCIHAMTYLSTSQQLQTLSVKETLHDQLGLLTQEELDQAGPYQHELPMAVVLSWLTAAVMEVLFSTSQPKGQSEKPFSLAFDYSPAYSQLAPLQKACENHKNSYVLNQPNFYKDVMFCAMTIFIGMVVLGEPFGSLVYVGHDTINTESMMLPCFQPMTIFSVFTLTVAVRTLFLSIMVLNNPFEYESEQISVDHLLASSERTMFFHIRANFGTHASSTIPEETTHTARESFFSFAEETRYSMASRKLETNQPSQLGRKSRSMQPHGRVSFADQWLQRASVRLGRLSDSSIGTGDFAVNRASRVSFAIPTRTSDASENHDRISKVSFATPLARESVSSHGLESLVQPRFSKVGFGEVLVEESEPMSPLSIKVASQLGESQDSGMTVQSGFISDLHDIDLEAGQPVSPLAYPHQSVATLRTLPLPGKEYEHDEPSVATTNSLSMDYSA